MVRDFDLIRKILIGVRDTPSSASFDVRLLDTELDPITIQEHCIMLIDAGFIDGTYKRIMRPGVAVVTIYDLTWQGHDFVGAATESVWDKAKSTVLNKATSMTFDVLYAWLRNEAATRLGLAI